jgi:hypothetical protein
MLLRRRSIKIITDNDLLSEIKGLFTSVEIEGVEKNLGEMTINYKEDITKIPGVFAAMSNELAMNDISIIDSMICHWEHIVITNERDLEKAFSVVHNLTRTGKKGK